MEPIKGMDMVVPAFDRIHAANPTANLLVAGDGSQRQLMERQMSDVGLDNAIEFLNRLCRVDVLLMPSRNEGFGLTAIEGMARGCVVVATDTGGSKGWRSRTIAQI